MDFHNDYEDYLREHDKQASYILEMYGFDAMEDYKENCTLVAKRKLERGNSDCSNRPSVLGAVKPLTKRAIKRAKECLKKIARRF
jgi:hypothetical protein